MQNVVYASFGASRENMWKARTSPLWQYDYGQILKITGVTLPSNYEVHFSNEKEGGTAKTVLGNADGVAIPDEYLTTGRPIYAWIFLHTGSSDGETVYTIHIPVRRRSESTDTALTPTEKSVVSQAVEALNTAVENAAADVAADLVDDTLSVTGKAADAAKTGEELSNLKSDLTYMSKGGIRYENVSVEKGQYVKMSDGTIASYPSITTWATSPLYRIPAGTYEILSNFNEGIGASAYSGFAVYDSDMRFKEGGRDLSSLTISEDWDFIRLTNYSADSDHSNLFVEFKVSELINSINTLKDQTNVLSDRTDIIESRGKYAVDKVSSFRNSFANKTISDSSTGSSFVDANNYTNSYIRLTTYQNIFSFDNDVSVYSDNGYVFKVISCDANGGIIEFPNSWVSEALLLEKKHYGITMKKIDDSKISTDEAIHLYADTANKTISTLDEKMRDEIIYGNNLWKYYDFYFKSIDTDNGIAFYGSSMERRSAIFSTSKPFTITMNSADYVFRLFWYENNLLHSYGWGRNWAVPANQIVGLTIKKQDSTAFAATETPEKYMTVYCVDGMPKDYFLPEIENTISDIRSAYAEPGLCFLLTTDQHTMSVQSPIKYDTISDMVVNMKEIAKKVHIDGLISLGDVADFKVGAESAFNAIGVVDLSYESLDNVFYAIMDDAMTKMASVHPNFYYVLGNHDDNRYINRDKIKASESAYDYTPEEIFAFYNARGTHKVIYNTDNNGLDYYVDFDQFKIRMFFIDANYYNETSQTSSYTYTKAWWYGFADSTVLWLENQLGVVPSDWSVIICSHLSPVKEHNEDNTEFRNFANIRNAIQAYIDRGGDYIATLYGHTHGDWSSSSPWLEISFACQKCQNYSITLENMPGIVWPTRALGTYTEDCWNVLLILPKSRKIKIIRFGAGEDREFSY